MAKSEIQNINLSHHAYLFIGKRDGILKDLFSHLKSDFNIEKEGNPDLIFLEYENMGIEEGRKLKEMHETKSWQNEGRRVFVICFNFIQKEAQNSLLKIFEDANPNTHFFVVVPNEKILIPTLLSRFHKINLEGDYKASENYSLAKEFVENSLKKRLEFVKNFMKEIDEEKKTKNDAVDFLDELERYFYRELKNNGSKIDEKRATIILEEIIKGKKYLISRSPSIKMILENLALQI